MTNDFKQYIAKRIAHTKELAREKREAEKKVEEDVEDIFHTQRLEDFVEVEVKVPLQKNGRPYFNLNKRFILKCLREGKLMKLTWPDGSALHKPEDWLKGEPYQKEFKFAGSPIEMVGNYLDLE